MPDIDQRRFDNQQSDFLSARAAAKMLGVKVQTIYAYASRGRLRSVGSGHGKRRSYLRADVERLRARKRARAGHGAVAADALRWGEPVLESAITAIAPDGHRYRGHSAVDLACADTPFESVAELLWTGTLPSVCPVWSARGLGARARQLEALTHEGATPLAKLTLTVAALGLADPGRFAASDDAELDRARPLIVQMAASLSLGMAPSRVAACFRAESVAATTALALGKPPKPAVVRAINRALVLSADHELNVSAFAARVAASARADLYASFGAALGAMSGPMHGGMTERVEALVDEVGNPRRAKRIINHRARRGDSIPGFGHPLYQKGDPRVAPLLEVARIAGSKRARLDVVLAIIGAMRDADRAPPTIDIALVAVAAALGLPRGAPSALFAVGRTAGWVAHVLEQRRAGFLLRPRAKYVGV